MLDFSPMFTGIIEATAPILDVSLLSLTVVMPKEFSDVKLGSSIAVNGCCLTISGLHDGAMSFDLTSETMEKTAFGEKKAGDLVNLERAMKADARLDGHVVQGHVEGCGEVVSAGNGELNVRIQKEFKENVVPKGSIAIDGVSLTIASIDDNLLTFAIVPFTWNHTIMASYSPGTKVHVETDILTRRAG